MSRFPALVMCLALALYVVLTFHVGRMRARHHIKAPAVTGAPELERAFRVQQNTVEQMILFLPALWLFAFYASATWSGIIGLVWVAARVLYAVSYNRNPETRGPGFAIGAVSSLILLVGGLIGVVAALV